jgi:hypothetical protein
MNSLAYSAHFDRLSKFSLRKKSSLAFGVSYQPNTAERKISGSGLAISAVEPKTTGLNEFWSGDRVLVNVVEDVLRPG